MNLVLFDFDKTIINRDTGAAYVKFMVCRNPMRLSMCFITTPLYIPFLLHKNTKFIGFSIILWLATFGMSIKKVVRLRRSFIRRYLNESATIIFKDAVQHLQLHTSNADQVVVVSGASQWMVKAIFVAASLPKVEFVCSEEAHLFGGFICKSHCYASNKVKRVRKLYNLEKYDSIIGYSDSSVDIPILKLCDRRYIVNPKARCFEKFSKSFNKTMSVLNWV
ncbi:HAD-IB family phosphatase [Alteromonas portus]|uniref:HAD-IB family phosphatase n=1 Tax=Alteromonas portus TaxID=2565549 RepID=UPI003BF91B80